MEEPGRVHTMGSQKAHWSKTQISPFPEYFSSTLLKKNPSEFIPSSHLNFLTKFLLVFPVPAPPVPKLSHSLPLLLKVHSRAQ